jgi:hypothetical protein
MQTFLGGHEENGKEYGRQDTWNYHKPINSAGLFGLLFIKFSKLSCKQLNKIVNTMHAINLQYLRSVKLM